jgi:serine/threonine protein kinase
MRDVACGLAFLHGQSPPTIHRDLTATNILLSEDRVAKLADFGMARPTDVVMTQLPGSAVYMPPEAAERKYGPPLDVFSYGVVALFTLTRVFPQNLLKPNYDGSGGLVARSELERRQEYMDILHNDQEIPPKHYLTQMIPQCLQNNPENRPLIQNVLTILELNQKIEQLQQDTDNLRIKTQGAKKVYNIMSQYYILHKVLLVRRCVQY